MQNNHLQNKLTLASLEVGDLVEFERGLYSHWGVYIGDENVVHLCGEDNDGINAGLKVEHVFTISGVTFDKANVCIDNFWDIVQNCKAYKNNKEGKVKKRALHPDEIVKNALSRLGHVGYNLITENCEHFATWCRYGEWKSDQVDTVMTGLAVGGAAVLTASLVAAVAKFMGSSEEDEKETRRKQRV